MTVLQIKAAVRERDGYRCIECGMTRAEHFARYERDLDVHRLNPGGDYTLEGCVTVCRSCHGSLPKSPVGENPNLNVWLPAELMAAFDAMRADTRRTKTAEVVLMFEECLKSRGYWPPTKPGA